MFANKNTGFFSIDKGIARSSKVLPFYDDLLYSFDESSDYSESGVVKSSVGEGGDRESFKGQCLQGDGSSHFTCNFTLSGNYFHYRDIWKKATGEKLFVGQGVSANNSVQIYWQNNDNIYVLIGTGTGVAYRIYTGSSFLDTNTGIDVVYDGTDTDKVKLYADGVLQTAATTSGTFPSTLQTAIAFYFLRLLDSGSYGVGGCISRPTFYNRANEIIHEFMCEERVGIYLIDQEDPDSPAILTGTVASVRNEDSLIRNQANIVGYTKADGSTDYRDDGGVNLYTANTIIPVLSNGYVACWDADGNPKLPTYTGKVQRKANIVATEPNINTITTLEYLTGSFSGLTVTNIEGTAVLEVSSSSIVCTTGGTIASITLSNGAKALIGTGGKVWFDNGSIGTKVGTWVDGTNDDYAMLKVNTNIDKWIKDSDSSIVYVPAGTTIEAGYTFQYNCPASEIGIQPVGMGWEMDETDDSFYYNLNTTTFDGALGYPFLSADGSVRTIEYDLLTENIGNANQYFWKLCNYTASLGFAYDEGKTTVENELIIPYLICSGLTYVLDVDGKYIFDSYGALQII